MMTVLNLIMPYIAVMVVCLLLTVPLIWGFFFTMALSGTFLGLFERLWVELRNKRKIQKSDAAYLKKAKVATAKTAFSASHWSWLLGIRPLAALVSVLLPILLGVGIALYSFDSFSVNKVTLIKSEAPKPVEFGASSEPLDGETLFVNNCSSCHQTNGLGVEGIYPPLVGTSWVLGEPEVIVKIVLNGLSGPIEVNSNTYNNVMPGFSGVLNSAEVAEVASYVRSAWGNEADFIDTELVDQVKLDIADRVVSFTAAELLE